MIGLLGREKLEKGEGLLLLACQSVHTWGMRFAIDVVFLDKQWRAVALYRSLGPSRMTRIHWQARSVLELPAGTIQQHGLHQDEVLEFLPSIIYSKLS